VPLLLVENLTVDYPAARGRLGAAGAVRALDGFSCRVDVGEAVGIIGESGAGKTTLALAVLNLLAGGAAVRAGAIYFNGIDLLQLPPRGWQREKIRGGKIGLIPQASQNAWNPVLTIGHQVAEHLENCLGISRRDAVVRAAAALRRAGLAETVLYAYPHQLSGGMRQRAAIAMIAAAEPALIIADECTNSLDVVNESEVLALLEDLRQTQNTALLVIAHDLTVIARLCRRSYVLYEGKTVEAGLTADILRSPAHPCTQKMVASLARLCASLG